MKYLHNFQKHDEMNEGLKNWVSTFLILAGLGLVPPSIAQGQNRRQQKEFVENTPQDKIDGALFVDYLNKLGIKNVSGLDTIFNRFKSSNPNVKSNYEDVKRYVNKSGKQFLFNQKYVEHDYSGVDITKFQPDNWLTDMGNMIDDAEEPSINNWISDYEKKTTVEIGIITINKLPEDMDIAEYALEQGRRLGVGKKGSDNGILIVLSKEDRKWNISTGYGMEGILPDITCSEIGQDEIVPHFKEGDYYGGVMAALEKIKSVVGYENVEDKKEWVRKNQEKKDAEMREMLSNIGSFLLNALLISLVAGLIGYGVYKKRKQLKELRELKERINEIIAKIEELKKKLPSSAGLPSKSLENIYQNCKKYFNEVNTTVQFTPENEKELNQMYRQMRNLFSSYKEKVGDIQNLQSEIGQLKSQESSTINAIESAVNYANKIKDYGYESPDVPSKSEVDKFSSLIPQILLLISTDIDQAYRLYKNFERGTEDIKNRAGGVATTLNSIENSISRSKNWESEVNRLIPRFKQAGGDISKLSAMVSNLRSFASTSKDWVKIAASLDKVLSFMNSVINEYDEEIRRKKAEEDRKRREEEDRRRKKAEEDRKRREEEEEDRNSYYSSSSSSSSSSDSFGGFGGGSFGGGGASGSW